jgi:SAM-dependent methyltransferase
LNEDHWQQHARDWRFFGPPLRPCAQDTDWMAQQIAASERTVEKALLLGVTPEIAQMQWPENTSLLAIDHSLPMIKRVWPDDNMAIPAQAIAGSWTSLPLKDQSIDIVCGDGVVLFFSYPQGVQRFFKEIKRVLKPGGLFLLRAFIQTQTRESLDQLHTDLKAGRIGSFHVYKWRLSMALQNSLQQGVHPSQIWQVWKQRVESSKLLAQQTGWPLAEIETIKAYQHATAVYHYPTHNELTQTFNSFFQVKTVTFPDYELGERCALIELVK